MVLMKYSSRTKTMTPMTSEEIAQKEADDIAMAQEVEQARLKELEEIQKKERVKSATTVADLRQAVMDLMGIE